MSIKGSKFLRITVMIILALLAVQFEFGMTVNMADPPDIPPFSFSLPAVSNALNGVGPVAVIHASLGAWLVIFSVLNLVLALRTGVRSVQVFGMLSLIAVLMAAFTGLLFVLSGFQNDGFSHGMATNFILSFTFYFLELYFLKPAPKVQKS